ncbi:MAG: DUF1517 domain-containing protein [Okeania sp. SIO3I5]|uniref:DUF1517 domain-containing protein n=1 Tax=Okeania sp. SIO3I5 TaxID=2607805 RepID=UPI0013BCA07C|nr:DUF1517 domain-containing protein [Okeania sp. SIO3I5]NEQ38896.1 DUF1517 domain-containing protein [Okeania sp. SIO3I5]
MRKSKFILVTIASLFLVNEVSINLHSNDLGELINTNASIAYARRKGGGSSRSSSTRSRSGSSTSTQPRDSKPKSTNNNIVSPKTNNTPPSTKPSPTSGGSSNRSGSLTKPSNTPPLAKPSPTSGGSSNRSGSLSKPSNTRPLAKPSPTSGGTSNRSGSFSQPNNTTRPTTNNINTGGKTRSGSFAPTTKKRYSVEPATGRRYYTRPGTQERYYQEAGTGRFYYVQPGTQRRYYMNVDNGQRYFIDGGTRRYYYEEVGTSRFYYVHPTTRVRYYYRPTFRERVVYTYYEGPAGVLPMFLLTLLLGIILICILYELVMFIAFLFGYRREVLVAEGDGYMEVIEESPGYVEVIEESPGYVEVIEESPGYVEVIEEELPVATVPEDLVNDIVTVSKLQVAMVAPANNIQSKLARISEKIDIETPEDRVEFLLQSAIALLQTQEHWTHVAASSETVETRQEAERIFEQFSFAERCKFEVNTVDKNVEVDDHIVVTLLLGTEDDYPLFDEINDRESFKKTLKELGKVTPDYLLVFELLWSPKTANDRLTYEQFVSEYNDMIQIS